MANLLQRYGRALNATDLKSKNGATVMLTADISAFVKPGARIDVTVSSMGDAKSLQGGVLLQTPLLGADGQVYAVSQDGWLAVLDARTGRLLEKHQLNAPGKPGEMGLSISSPTLAGGSFRVRTKPPSSWVKISPDSHNGPPTITS